MTKPLEPWEKAIFLVLILIGILASVAFPPLWIVYLLGGVVWFAYQATKRGRKD